MFEYSQDGSVNQYRSGGGSPKKSATYARVVDVITDSFHEKYDEKGKSQSINGVFFRPLGQGIVEDTEEVLPFAYCNLKALKYTPLVGELVEIEYGPNYDRTNSAGASQIYWKRCLEIWNHPHHAASPVTDDNDFGEYFVETTKVNPLQLFPGDVTIEGRHGNTIRFGGTNYDSNIFSDDDNNGKPYVIIKAGQKEAGDAMESVVEDINEDDSSIYLTSDHTIELTQANEKRDAWDQEPEKADEYKGRQVIIDSGRIYFNAKDEGIFLSSKINVGINAEYVGIDGEKFVSLDAKKIYLGSGAQEETEPVLKGDSTTAWLENLCSQLDILLNSLGTPGPPPAYVAANVASAKAVQPIIKTLSKTLKNLHSRKVYVDNL